MSEKSPNLMPLKLEEIRREQARTNDNVGALASSIVSMRREFERAHADIQRDLTSLRSAFRHSLSRSMTIPAGSTRSRRTTHSWTPGSSRSRRSSTARPLAQIEIYTGTPYI